MFFWYRFLVEDMVNDMKQVENLTAGELRELVREVVREEMREHRDVLEDANQISGMNRPKEEFKE
jgi:hypothetical protein